jgi:hypothetical protein
MPIKNNKTGHIINDATNIESAINIDFKQLLQKKSQLFTFYFKKALTKTLRYTLSLFWLPTSP